MDTPPQLILASGSAYKKSLLARLPLHFEAVDADIDETRQEGESPDWMARRLAEAKAATVASQFPEAFVLGCDQVIALGDQCFSKPGTAEKAVEQLMALQGNTHRLITSICLIAPGAPPRHSEVPFQMVMRPLSRAAIEAYVAEDEPFDCAGSYKIEAGGIRLFETTRGDDPTAIEGLPLTRVWTLLLQAGWPHE